MLLKERQHDRNLKQQIKHIICSVKIDQDTKEKLFFDCNEDIIASTNAMNRRYRKKRAVRTDNTNTPIVWMLIGKNEMNEEICLQVGRNKNLQRMLSTDIRLDVHEIRSGDENTKYGQLVKEYRALEFYEIDIDNYLKEDDVFCKCFGQIPQNEYLASAYFTLRAAYVEGKVVAEYGCRKEKDNGRMWCPSPDGLDGSFYEYWKKVNEGNLG